METSNTKPLIYESPDKGATIYVRDIGTTDRMKIRYDKSLYNDLMEDKMWGEIRRLAKTNPAMREYTDRCIELYHLLKETK